MKSVKITVPFAIIMMLLVALVWDDAVSNDRVPSVLILAAVGVIAVWVAAYFDQKTRVTDDSNQT